MSPTRSQPGSRTEIRLGARAHPIQTTHRAHASPAIRAANPSTARLDAKNATDKRQRMALPMGTRRLGPDNASLQVRSYREGVAAKAGHDLIIDVMR